MGDDVAELPATRVPRKERESYAPASRYKSPRTSSLRSNPLSDMTAAISSFGKDAFCIIDDTLTCHSLSENWKSVSGFAAPDDIGEGLREHIAPDHIHKVTTYLTAGDTTTAPVRFQIKHADGHWRWCELQLAEVTEGSEPRYKCLVRDVTEIHSAQRKIEKAKLEAELANKSRSEFLANMSHELRTPLNAILGFAQMIEGGTYGEIGHPKYHDYIGSIQESGTTLLSKINDLLEIANIDSGRMALNEAPTDLVGIIRHAIEAHSHHAFSEQVSLRDRLPDEPLVAVVDRIRLLQVLTNLISNAIKYNRQHGTVDIFCENRKDGGINIVIQDNGGGIPESHLQRILLAFEQDNSFFARSRNCVGLGLALSKEIVKLHQGRIHIESEYGKGTLLTIQLPKERTVKQQRTVKMLESAEALPVS